MRYLHITQEIVPCGDRGLHELITFPLHHAELEIEQFHRNVKTGGSGRKSRVRIERREDVLILQKELRRKQIRVFLINGAFVEKTDFVESVDAALSMENGVSQFVRHDYPLYNGRQIVVDRYRLYTLAFQKKSLDCVFLFAELLKKEFSLCLHPAALIMLPLAAIVLAPNYPYGIIFFYSTLGLFFICMGGRENQDVLFTMTLCSG